MTAAAVSPYAIDEARCSWVEDRGALTDWPLMTNEALALSTAGDEAGEGGEPAAAGGLELEVYTVPLGKPRVPVLYVPGGEGGSGGE